MAFHIALFCHGPDEMTMDNQSLISLYRQMLLIRVFEDKSAEMYTKAKIAGFLHLTNGQEAIAVGAMSALGLGVVSKLACWLPSSVFAAVAAVTASAFFFVICEICKVAPSTTIAITAITKSKLIARLVTAST